jgi:CRP-like cAMP-binding protein
MKYKRIPQDLQNEVRNYYTYLWKSGKGLDKNKVLDDLPPYLKTKMSVILNSEIIKKVPLFQQCKDDTDFINEIVKCLKPRVCLPNSFIVRKGEVGNEMFFISRGELNVVSEDDKVVFTLKDGGFFGEIALLYDTKRTASIVARTYCDMFVLTKEDFKKVMKKFPVQSKGIKEIAKERFQSIVDAEKKKEEEKNADEQEREGENEASNAEQENGVRNEEESMDKKDEE